MRKLRKEEIKNGTPVQWSQLPAGACNPKCVPGLLNVEFLSLLFFAGKRIMVAVRSTLKLDVPIAADKQLLVSPEYLRFLVRLSNEKFAENVVRTDK